MDANHGDTDGFEPIHCSVCNISMDPNNYKYHIDGKKHKKNVAKAQPTSREPNEPSVCQPQFVFQEPAPLDIQFKSFLNQVLLSKGECMETTSRILSDIEPILKREFGNCWPFVFGSMASGLALVGSDVDLYVDLGIFKSSLTSANLKEELKRTVSRCTRALRKDGRFSHVIPISLARVPIVKCLHQSTGVSCDISFKDSLGVHNSQLLQFYLSLNPRFLEVMVAIKFWAKESHYCKCSAITSYAWTLLFISFLQTLKLPNGERLVPSVCDLQRGFQFEESSVVNGWRVDFHPRQTFVRLPDEPQYSHFGLLKGFFNYYKSFSFEENIVCPYLGQPIPWSALVRGEASSFPPEFQWYENEMKTHLPSKAEAAHQIVFIQDPFQHNFFLGGSCSRNKYEAIVKGLQAAAADCEVEEQLADPNASKFLTSLFTSQPNDREVKLEITIKEIPGVQKQALCEHVALLLENIFTKIMKFEIKPERDELFRPRGEPETKVAKRTEMQDVHKPNDFENIVKKYHCAAVHPVWVHRKRIRKEVRLAYPETTFEFETKVSDAIVGYNYPSQRIEFLCNVQIGKALVVAVTLKDDGKQCKGTTNELYTFLKHNLKVWVIKFLSEELQEPAVLEALRSEPDSYKEGVQV